MVLSTCCTHEEKQRIWAAAQVYADQFARDQPNIYVVWDAVPNHISPFGVIIAWWGGESQESQGPVPIRRNEKVHLEASQL